MPETLDDVQVELRAAAAGLCTLLSHIRANAPEVLDSFVCSMTQTLPALLAAKNSCESKLNEAQVQLKRAQKIAKTLKTSANSPRHAARRQKLEELKASHDDAQLELTRKEGQVEGWFRAQEALGELSSSLLTLALDAAYLCEVPAALTEPSNAFTSSHTELERRLELLRDFGSLQPEMEHLIPAIRSVQSKALQVLLFDSLVKLHQSLEREESSTQEILNSFHFERAKAIRVLFKRMDRDEETESHWVELLLGGKFPFRFSNTTVEHLTRIKELTRFGLEQGLVRRGASYVSDVTDFPSQRGRLVPRKAAWA